MAKKKNFKHFRDRDAPSEWVKPLSACSFTKFKKEFNNLNQLSLWPEENQNESGIIKFHEVE